MEPMEDVEFLEEEDVLDLNHFSFADDKVWSSTVKQNLAPNTMIKLRFVSCLFEEWRKARNRVSRLSPSLQIPEKIITEFSAMELCRWIPLFLVEIRRKDGGFYRTKSVLEFLLCIQTLFFVEKDLKYAFLKDEQFISIRNAVDNVMKALEGRGRR